MSDFNYQDGLIFYYLAGTTLVKNLLRALKQLCSAWRTRAETETNLASRETFDPSTTEALTEFALENRRDFVTKPILCWSGLTARRSVSLVQVIRSLLTRWKNYLIFEITNI